MGVANKDLENEKAGVVATFFNVINSFFGAAVLGLPYGFRMSGHLAGVITLVAVGLISRYCMWLLLQCREFVILQSKGNRGSYGDIGEFAYGKKGRMFVDAALAVTQFGFCCVYMIFLGNNVNDLVPLLPPNVIIVFCIIFLSLLSWCRSLKWLSPFSLLAECCTVAGLVVVNWYAVGLISEQNSSVRTHAFRPSTFPVFFGIATAAYEGIGLVIPIQQSMKEPQKYNSVLNISFIFVTTFFIVSGVTSYQGFGDDTKSIVTLNLPDTMVSVIVIFMLCVAIFFTYPVQMFVLLEIAESVLNVKPRQQKYKSRIIRTSFVCLTGLVAILIPHFGEVIGLLGSIGCPILAYVLPAIFYAKLYKSGLSTTYQLVLSGVVAIGILGGLTACLDVLVSVDE